MALPDNKTADPGVADLSRDFRRSTLSVLQAAFLAAAAPEQRSAAISAIEHFHVATQSLRENENAFRQRNRQSERPSLLKHLRTPEQMAAVRDFYEAREALLDINAELGRPLAQLVAQSLAQTPTNAAAAAPATPSV